jgi:hypothetical protein
MLKITAAFASIFNLSLSIGLIVEVMAVAGPITGKREPSHADRVIRVE